VTTGSGEYDHGEVTMTRDRRRIAVAQIAADVVIVLLAAYLTTVTTALIFAIVLGFFFVRWWRRADVEKPE
jgi:Flp pilus assembly protein TadB